MGRQFNFYMSTKDEADFLAFLEPFQFVYCRRDCRSEVEIAPLSLNSEAELPRGDIIVFCRESDWPDVTVHRTDWGFIVGWGSSPCIEWITCEYQPSSISVQEGHITRGRIYCATDYLDGDLIQPKSNSLIAMFEKLRRYLKKVCIRTTEKYEFAAPDAARLSRAGRVRLVMDGSDPARCRGTELAADND